MVTPIKGLPSACAKPSAKAMAVRRPVKPPGPTPTATASKAVGAICASPKTCWTMGGKCAGWPRAASCKAAANTAPSRSTAAEQRASAPSMARMSMFRSFWRGHGDIPLAQKPRAGKIQRQTWHFYAARKTPRHRAPVSAPPGSRASGRTAVCTRIRRLAGSTKSDCPRTPSKAKLPFISGKTQVWKP